MVVRCTVFWWWETGAAYTIAPFRFTLSFLLDIGFIHIARYQDEHWKKKCDNSAPWIVWSKRTHTFRLLSIIGVYKLVALSICNYSFHSRILVDKPLLTLWKKTTVNRLNTFQHRKYKSKSCSSTVFNSYKIKHFSHL